MSKIERFEDLEVWKMARSFSKNIYLTLEKKPFLKDYRLRDQMRGSVGSIKISQSLSGFIKYLKAYEFQGTKYK